MDKSKWGLGSIVFLVALVVLPTVARSWAVPFRPPISGNALQQRLRLLRQPPSTVAPRCVDDVRSNLYITALVPETVMGLTVSETPTFFVFIPTGSQGYQNRWNPTLGQFTLKDEQENVVYQTTFNLTGNPGVVSFQLPTVDSSGNSAKGFRLELNKTYIWKISVLCSSDEPGHNPGAGGIVQRVEPTAELAMALKRSAPQEYPAIYANAGIWYEALTTLAQQRRSHPQDNSLTANWVSLLKSVNLENIAQQPLLSCCQTP